MTVRMTVLAAAVVALAALAGDVAGVFCKYCGQEARDARSLLTSPCPKHSDGFAKGRYIPAR